MADFAEQLRERAKAAVDELRQLVAEKQLELDGLKRTANMLAARHAYDVPFPEVDAAGKLSFPPGVRSVAKAYPSLGMPELIVDVKDMGLHVRSDRFGAVPVPAYVSLIRLTCTKCKNEWQIENVVAHSDAARSGDAAGCRLLEDREAVRVARSEHVCTL